MSGAASMVSLSGAARMVNMSGASSMVDILVDEGILGGAGAW